MFFPYMVTLIHGYRSDFFTYKKNANTSITLSGKMISIKNCDSEMDMEYFIPLVVFSMMPIDTPAESLKAQFIITRTYLEYISKDNNTINAEDLSLSYTTYDELEKKWGQDYETNYSYTMELLKDTCGQKIYYNDQLICPYYHELSAGITNDGEFPYLKSVDAAYDRESEKFINTFYFTKDELIQKLNGCIEAGEKIDFENSIKINNEDNNVYVRSVTIKEQTIPCQDFVKMLNLSSHSFTISPFEDGIKIVCQGIGDGLGLSVNSSISMAEKGENYTTILNYFYKDTIIK